jgi:general secretion pathway protein G
MALRPHAVEGFTMQRRIQPATGFTLLELLVVLVVLGLLAGIVAPKYFSQLGRSEAKVARAQIEGLGKALDLYRLEVGHYPSSEQACRRWWSPPVARRAGPAYLQKAVPQDPWGRPTSTGNPARTAVSTTCCRWARTASPAMAKTPKSPAGSKEPGHALSAQGPGQQGVVQLQVEAEDADQARRQAEDQGLRVLSARSGGWPARPALAPRAAFDLVLFSQELTTLLNAGLPLIDALESLAEKAPAGGARKVLASWCASCMKAARCPRPWPSNRVFPPLYVALVQSSERTGRWATP